ncbi:hypothetical protein [Streptomyces sp. NPDC096153]|uniref:hypothetical protein n=1 Tax=Streptomyces sp. NPDC096153 TaxID=3155548 RepID=UPI003331B38A
MTWLDRLAAGAAAAAKRRTDALATWVERGRRDDLHGWRASVGPMCRLAILAVVAYVGFAIVRAVPWLMWLVTLAFLREAWRAGADEDAEEEPPAPDEGAAAEAVRVLLADLIADRPGVHLSAVLDRLQQEGHGEGWAVADLRARLVALGVPVRRSVKVAGRVAYGVHRDDLPAPSPAESAERVA